MSKTKYIFTFEGRLVLLLVTVLIVTLSSFVGITLWDIFK